MTTLSPSSNPSTLTAIGPLVAAVFLGFVAVSLPLATLPLDMRDELGAGAVAIGWVIGLQSLATLLTRPRAGAFCDGRGPRAAVLLGLPLTACSGLAYALSTLPALEPVGRLALLGLGRVLAGLGESLFITGLMSWGIARLGPARTGTVMSWVGIAIYAALGLGAPIGLALHSRAGFATVGAATALAPLAAWVIALRLPPVPPSGGRRVPFHLVLGLIWRPGLVLTLATVPFAALAAFLSLDYAAHGWPQAGTALFGFGAAYVLVRLLFAGLADRIGAVPVAVGSLGLEAVGQLLLWQATSPALAAAGATVTGLGFSLVFPAMGVVATRSVPPQQRGAAVGNYIAFADIALGLTGPVVGLAVQQTGISAAFVVGAAATMAALALLPTIKPVR